MRLDQLQRNWDALGRADPMWAVLTDPAKRGNRWDAEEFFATGRREIAALEGQLEALGLAPARREHVLDFGCGLGRLTQALAERYARATGVDIAPSMVEQARAFNRHGARVEYVVNDAPDLRRFADDAFDLVFSHITLQHVRPPVALAYVAEFVRVMRPDGLCVFQLPSAWHGGLRMRLRMALPEVFALARRLRGRGPSMEMHVTPRARVEAAVAAAGGRVVHALDDPDAGAAFSGLRYVVKKGPARAP
jgi:SAM-dependent methyltransferase